MKRLRQLLRCGPSAILPVSLPALPPALLLLAILAALRPMPVSAAPRIEIRAAAVIEIQSVEPAGETSMRVIGQVRDTYSGQPIANALVRGRIDDVAFLRTTDENGRFVAISPSPHPPQLIEAALQYDRYIEGTPLSLTAPAVNRPMPVLNLAATVAGASLRLDLSLETSMPDGSISYRPFEFPVQLSATQGDTTLSLADTFIGSGQFDLSLLPSPGPWSLRAVFAGSERWAATDATATIELTGQGALSLRLRKTSVHADRYIEATGAIARADGGAVPTVAIVLMAGTTRLATTTSDAAGHFSFAVPGNALPLGRHALSVALDTPIAYVTVAPSPLQWVVITGVSAQTRLGAIAGVVCTALAVFLVVWLERRWRKRQRPPHDKPARKPGFAPAPPSLSRRLLRSPQRSIRLQVFDAASGRPIFATVTATNKLGVETTVDAAHGTAELALADGRYDISVGSPVHQAVTQPLDLPHHGEWTNRAVYLISTRDHLFELYAAAVAPFVQISPNIQSPARIIAQVKQSLAQRPGLAGNAYAHIEELTQRIERVYFTDQAVAATDVAAIGQLTTALSQGLR